MITIRPIELHDAAIAASLAEELGYPSTEAIMEARIRRLTASAGHAVFVAEENGIVLGWIDLSVEQHLQSEPRARIGGLVVSEAARGQGIGAMLCRRAEDWGRELGLAKIMLTSRATRERAHAFYERDGYQRVKTSLVFEKTL
ncbi:GNAT family N-acetyltransferase [Terriglobus tenax]|uniref:GNAT family N-acetyltransferase n=1 Tax=Terriglobus tenax TaxID=1111115 RepID=UPI0021E04BE0|nr:GNAT family N-acetyltransferase [Terriglobus tenax]